MKQLVINNILVEIERKKIKNMYLKVLPTDQKVRISAPLRIPEDEIRRFVLSKYEWIIRQQRRMQERAENKELNYVSGEEVFYKGKKYTLKVIPVENNVGVTLLDDMLLLKVKPNSNIQMRARILNQWYKEYLLERIPELIIKWEQIIGVKSSSLVIRDMKTRWGSCNIRTGKICINLRLAQKKPISLEYVVVHELVHLLEGSHNQVFKGYMDRFLPDWRTIKKELNY